MDWEKWHRIFHAFKACWHNTGYTEWKTSWTERHGPYITGVQVTLHQYCYPTQQCCKCPKNRVRKTEAVISLRSLKDGEPVELMETT